MNKKITIYNGQFALALVLILITLKLAGVITWPWWLVLLPLWIPFAIMLVAFFIAIVVIFIKSYKD